MSSEQWIEGGDCSICRRQKFCNKECKQRRLYQQRRMASMALAFSARMYADILKGKK